MSPPVRSVSGRRALRDPKSRRPVKPIFSRRGCHESPVVECLAMPVDTLVSNWAYMVMASLAWTLKAWAALLLGEQGRWATKHREEKRTLLRMEFGTFVLVRRSSGIFCVDFV